ncbi:hypothetical protein AKJ16_DCAP04016 [Drosera capensis]
MEEMLMFFSSSSTSTTTTTTISGHHSYDQIILLSGPPSSGKTSLLFQFALNTIAQSLDGGDRRPVEFLCCRRRLQSKPPFLSKGIDSESESFDRIRIKYVEDEDDVKRYFAAFHLHDTLPPLAVIVDDFGGFFDQRNCQERYANARGRDLATVRTLALCRNAMLHANEKAPCKLLLSDTQHGHAPRLLFIYKRWVSSIFTIKGDGAGCFLLTNSTNVNNTDMGQKSRIARYSIALQYLALEEITEDADD